ncbi:MAG TPA: DUF6263 family protein [Flavisolibacter sp.]|nr:DUF6263 family protein [Flavisolibacter sp.]
MKKLFFFAAIAFSVTGYAQKVSNKLMFPKGGKLELVTETKKSNSAEVMGQSMESTVSTTLTESYDIEDAGANGATIEYKIKHLVLNANGMGQSQSFDSEKQGDRDGELGKLLEKSLKNKYKMTVDPYGKVVTVKVDDDNPNDKNAAQDPMAGMVAMQLGFNPTVPKPGDVTSFKILPAREVGPGDTWVDSASTEGTKRTTTYKVNSITADEVLLDYTENVDVNSTQQIMGQEAAIKSTDKATGQIRLDRKTGLLKQKTATIDNSATIEAQGMSIPSSGKTTITVTVKQS